MQGSDSADGAAWDALTDAIDNATAARGSAHLGDYAAARTEIKKSLDDLLAAWSFVIMADLLTRATEQS